MKLPLYWLKPQKLFIYNKETDLVLICFQSLNIIFKALYKRLKIKKKGQEGNYKGEIFEDLIHSNLNIFELKLYHPLTHKPFIGIQLDDKKYGDIDIMGYNDEFLILIESKYWNLPILSSLEKELDKFYERCNYIQKDLDVLKIPDLKNKKLKLTIS